MSEIYVADLCWLVEIARTGGLVEIQVQDLCWLVEIASIQVADLCWLVSRFANGTGSN